MKIIFLVLMLISMQVTALLPEEIATYVYTSSSSTQSLGADYQKQFVQNGWNEYQMGV